MVETVADVARHGDRIRWELPPLSADLVDWATAHINETLHEMIMVEALDLCTTYASCARACMSGVSR